MPHAGFPTDLLESTYAKIRKLVAEANRCRMRVVVGGDFNSVEHSGMRGRLLDQFLAHFNLKILNKWNADDNWEDVWSFCNSSNAKRKIDYIISKSTCIVSKASASNALGLNSDHRATFADISLPASRSVHRRRRLSFKGWTTECDEDGTASLYHHRLHAEIGSKEHSSFQDLTNILIEASQPSSIKPKCALRSVWRNPNVQALVAQRRASRDLRERRTLSKTIPSKTRALKRVIKHRDLEATLQ